MPDTGIHLISRQKKKAPSVPHKAYSLEVL
jgi:hypothetical protein